MGLFSRHLQAWRIGRNIQYSIRNGRLPLMVPHDRWDEARQWLYETGVDAAADKWARALERVTPEDWADAARDKFSERLKDALKRDTDLNLDPDWPDWKEW